MMVEALTISAKIKFWSKWAHQENETDNNILSNTSHSNNIKTSYENWKIQLAMIIWLKLEANHTKHQNIIAYM